MAKLDLEALKNQEGNLTPEQEAAIADEAYEEVDNKPKEEPEDKTPKEEPKKKPDEEEEPGKEKEPEKKDDKPEEPEKEEETPAEGKEEKEEKPEDEETPEPEKPKEEKPEDAKPNIEEEAKALAIEKNISLDDAKAVIEKETAIAEKYGNDPKKLARAYRENQSAYDKLKTQNKALQEAQIMPLEKVPTETEVIALIKKGALKDERGAVITEESIVETYRKEHSDIADDLEDDKILKLAAHDIVQNVAKDKKELVGKVKEAAKVKRDKCMSLLPETDKHLESQIKEAIDNMSDLTVVSDTFNFNDIVRWARGSNENIASLVKKAREEGIKIGKESPVIEGVVPSESGGGRTPAKKSQSISTEELRRAHEMFDGTGMTEKEMIKAYLEDKEHEESLKNKNKEK